jgi:DnaK suppressor protein
MPKSNPKKTKPPQTGKPAVKKIEAPKKAVKAGPAQEKDEKAEKSGSKRKGNFKKEMVRTLLTAKQKILEEVSHKVKSESNVLKHEIGDIYDIASAERERELSLMLGDRDRQKLAEIDDAIERINESSYGVCEECAEAIAEDRLRAMPFTRVCVECQSKSEREKKLRERFEEEPGLGILEKSESEEEEF